MEKSNLNEKYYPFCNYTTINISNLFQKSIFTSQLIIIFLKTSFTKPLNMTVSLNSVYFKKSGTNKYNRRYFRRFFLKIQLSLFSYS